MNNIKEYYEILGESEYSSIEQIRKSYIKKMKEFHPDINKNDGDMAKKINTAYEYLKKNHVQKKKNTKPNSNNNSKKSNENENSKKGKYYYYKLDAYDYINCFNSERTKNYFIKKLNSISDDDENVKTIIHEMVLLYNRMNKIREKLVGLKKIPNEEEQNLIKKIDSCINLSELEIVSNMIDIFIKRNEMIKYLKSKFHIPNEKKERIAIKILNCTSATELDNIKGEIETLEKNYEKDNIYYTYIKYIDMTSLSEEQKNFFKERIKYCRNTDDLNNILKDMKNEEDKIKNDKEKQQEKMEFEKYKNEIIKKINCRNDITDTKKKNISRLIFKATSVEKIENILNVLDREKKKSK